MKKRQKVNYREAARFNFREAYERIAAIKARLSEMADSLEKDKTRDALNEAEEGEKKQLLREMDIIEMKIRANTPTIEVMRQSDIEDANKKVRECVKNGQRFELKVSRAVSSSFNGNASGYADPSTSTNPSALTTHEIVEPLYQRTILPLIGAPLLTGLKGNHQWPVVESFEATINDEAAQLGDKKIPVGKLIAKPERIGVAVPITREALNETDNLLQTVCTQYMPVAVACLMNKIMFSTEKVTGATNLVGPFVNIASKRKKTYAGEIPTLKELIDLKSTVLSTNIMPEGLCYVTTESMKGALEATPKWEGSSFAIVDDNGRINGVPVFCSSYVKEGDVLFGSFKYSPIGLFGDISIIIDPYTLARKNSIDFVMNADYAITVLREEAFAMMSKS